MKRTPSLAISRCGVLAAGNWIIDHIKVIDTWPAQDTLATILRQCAGNGGGPYNLLKDLARMGCGFPLAGIGLVGKDADGAHILEDCRAHRIDCSRFQQTEAAPTSFTDVMTVAGTGRRTFFHQHGANGLLGLEHVSLTGSPAKIFYLGYMCLLHTLDRIDGEGRTGTSRLFEAASAQGMITVGDLVSNETSDFAGQINPSLPHLDYLLLNEYELARLTGLEVGKSPAQLRAAAGKLLERGVRRGVIVHLPEFALGVSRAQPAIWQPSVRMPHELIRGAAGAGDAFAAGFVFGLHEGWKMAPCLELGVCVAATSLRDETCSATVESWADCLAFGKEMGFNPLPEQQS